MMQQVLQAMYAELLPVLLQLIAAILGMVLLRAAEAARRRWGIEIEARHREALHAALMTGVSAALARGLQGTAAIDAATVYARTSVPDAIATLKPDAVLMRNLAAAKLHQAQPLLFAEAAQ
ncbi:hypothetical protein [Gemmobacter serpentinus]|uniref:hypothetical protein n=1 Tax=Gemmobacter serpentinus TaxID=2652247 RepID=UPI00124CE129|nr:hypothetical protein [Gemmobacter serpentinus]